MTYDMLLVLIALGLAVALFATECIRVDLTAVLIMGVLMVSGVLTAEEGLSGFSNPATATVAAMFILSAAVQKTGILVPVTRWMTRAFKKNFWLGFLTMMVATGVLSAFVNNTPVVALMIPVIIAAVSQSGASPSRVLIPLSYVSMFGGVCTLVGTSTNILVSNLSEQYGYGGLQMFEMTPLGLIFFGAGCLYMIFIGYRLLPDKGKSADPESGVPGQRYITNIFIRKEALEKIHCIGDIPFYPESSVEIIQVRRGSDLFYLPSADFQLMESDIVKIRSDIKKIRDFHEMTGLDVRPLLSEESDEQRYKRLRYVEAIIAPGSSLVGRLFEEIDFRNTYRATILGIREREGLMQKLMRKERILSGDTFFLAVDEEHLRLLKSNTADFILISEPEFPKLKMGKAALALGIVSSVILLASLNILPILFSAIGGCILLILTGCLKAEDAYRAVDWKVIFLLAGAMSFGIALKKTGLADIMAQFLITFAGDYGPVVLLSLVYLLTSLLTEAMSNNATVVLFAPVMIALAFTLGVSPRPFLIAITFAASSSFMTPVGYQTNTMVYAAGNYSFKDFFKVGTGLNILFWILATIFIPVFFPF